MKDSFFKSFSQLFALSTLGYVISFFNQMATSYYFGTSTELDGYLTLIATAGFLLFYINPIRDTLIKTVYTSNIDNPVEVSKVFSSALLVQIALGILSLLIFLLLPTSSFLSNKFIGNVSNNTFFIFMPYFLLFGVAEMSNGLLISFNRLKSQAISRLLSSIIGLLTLLIFAKDHGIIALILSLQLTQLIVFIISSFSLYKEGIRFVWSSVIVIFKSNGFLAMFSSLLMSYFFAQIYVVSERYSMINMSSGLVSSFQYSVALVNVGISIIVQPALNLIWPKFLDHNNKGEEEGIIHLAEKSILLLSAFLIIGCTFVFWNAYDIVELIYSRGKFGQESINITGNALKASIYTAVPIAIYGVITRILITKGLGKTLAFAAITIAFVGITILVIASLTNNQNLIFYHWFIGNSFGAIIAIILMKKKFKLFFCEISKLLTLTFKVLSMIAIALLSIHLLAIYSISSNLIIFLSLKFLLYSVIIIITGYLFGLKRHLMFFVS
jgi:peptidoglycan biosynthesis protein MviN/MurJ (putative lipid II flippase)